MFVGGEFFYDTRWLADQATISTDKMTFLNGGKACLVVISDYLLDHGINKILLPSYLCPTIVTTLEACGLVCDYYQIHPDFSIDLNDLAQKIVNHQAVYFINYFGFFHSLETQNYLTSLQQKGIILVEDNAQGGFHPLLSNQEITPNHCPSDFIFNSMRKLSAYDGGYLSTALDVRPYIRKHQGCSNRRLPIIRKYRQRLADYLYQGVDIYTELEQLYELAEYYYEMDFVVEGDQEERQQIERMDWNGIRQVRRKNYEYLLSLISGISELSPIFPILQERIMPLGLPVYVSGISRDGLFDELGNSGIGLTIHWDGLLHDTRLNGNSIAVNMARKILTLVIDQRTSHTQMDYVAQKIFNFINHTKSKDKSSF